MTVTNFERTRTPTITGFVVALTAVAAMMAGASAPSPVMSRDIGDT
jgi:hypothetical protein